MDHRRLETEKSFHDDAVLRPKAREPISRLAAGLHDPAVSYFLGSISRLIHHKYGMAARVLDYGCGQGDLAGRLSAMGLENLWGIDISEGMISRAKSQFPAIAFRVMDCERLEFPDESFDLVAGWAILHHCNRSAALSEVARVLKPGGSAVFWEPLGHNPFLALARSLSPGARTQYERPLTVPDLERLGDHFREVKVSEFVLLPILFAPFRFIIGERPFARVLKHLVRGDEWIRAHLTWMRRHYWSVVIEVEK